MFYIAYTAYMNEHKAANQTDELRKLKVEAHNRKDIFPSTPPQTPSLSHFLCRIALHFTTISITQNPSHTILKPQHPPKSPVIYNGEENKHIEVLTSGG